MDLAKSLRKAMAEKNIKGKDLAAAIDVPPSLISRWRQDGNMNHVNLVCICKALEMRVHEFVKLGEE